VLIGAAFVSPVVLGWGKLCGCSQYKGYLPKNGSVPIRRDKRYRVFNNCSQMTLQMKREALEELNQYANETGRVLAQSRRTEMQ